MNTTNRTLTTTYCGRWAPRLDGCADCLVAALQCDLRCRLPVALQLLVGAKIEQKLGDVLSAMEGGQRERKLSVEGLVVDIGPCHQQRVRGLFLPIACCK